MVLLTPQINTGLLAAPQVNSLMQNGLIGTGAGQTGFYNPLANWSPQPFSFFPQQFTPGSGVPTLTPPAAPPATQSGVPAIPVQQSLLTMPNGDSGGGGGPAGNGTGADAGGTGGTGSSGTSSGVGHDVSPAGVSSGLGLGLGPVGTTAAGIGLTGLGAPPGSLSAIDTAIGMTQANNSLSKEGAPTLGLSDALSAFAHAVSMGLVGTDIDTAAAVNNNSTAAAKGIGVPTGSIDIGNSLTGPKGSADVDPTNGPAAPSGTGDPNNSNGGNSANGGGNGGSTGGGNGGQDGGDGPGGGSGDGDGCFTGETPILMADGSEKPIRDVRPGDLVAAFDGLGPLEPCRVTAKIEHDLQPTLAVAGRVYTTSEHPFLVASGNFVPASWLRKGDRLVAADGSRVTLIEDPTPTGAREAVYNLTVDRHHTYVAGGLRVHNKYAYGGLIAGRGAPHQDNIKTTVSSGEFVVQQPAVKALGNDAMRGLNLLGSLPAAKQKAVRTALLASLKQAGLLDF